MFVAKTDTKGIWHPYSQEKLAKERPFIQKAKGAYLYTDEGKAYFDATSSWGVITHGHNHPYMMDELSAQLHTLDQVLFADFDHLPVCQLSEKLLTALGKPFSRLYFSDNGSCAVEAALKMARRKKGKILTFSGGYHGETLGALALMGEHPFTRDLSGHGLPIEWIPPPLHGEEEATLQALGEIEGEISCFIYEPLLQGAGANMKTYSRWGLEKLLKQLKQRKILTIADEVLTGFGRCGPLFASHLLETRPDIICLGKGLTGGTIPLGITAVTEEVFSLFWSNSREDAFLHGHSYAGNPLACQAALANLALFDQNFSHAHIIKGHQQFHLELKNRLPSARIETFGTFLIIEFPPLSKANYLDLTRDHITRFFIEKGIAVRPFGNVLWIAPPYCTTTEELKWIYETIDAFAASFCRS